MRSALLLPFLTLAACAPAAEKGEEQRGLALPVGFELASVEDDAAAAPVAPIIDVTPAELRARLGGSEVRLIDVRTDKEVAEGVIPGAEHVALSEFDPASLDLASGDTVVLYCRSGARSAKAARLLAEHSGEPVRHLAGGILAWQEAGGELVTPDVSP